MLESGRLHFSRWVLAALIALGAHVASAALTFMHWEEEEADDAGGAVVIELAPMAAVAPVDSPDLAHGPVMDEIEQTTQAAKKVEQDVPKEIPKVEPSPAPGPEVALPKPQPKQKEKPKEEEEVSEAVPEQQNEQQQPQVQAAPPRVEAQPSPNAAPSLGRSASLAQAQATWQKLLLNHLNRHKRYPSEARNRREQGTVLVAFKINRAGNLVASHIVRSSGSSILDEEALTTLKRADPMPPPSHADTPNIDLTLPIQFQIK